MGTRYVGIYRHVMSTFSIQKDNLWVQFTVGQNVNINVGAAQNAVSRTPKVRDIEHHVVCSCPVLRTAHGAPYGPRNLADNP